MQQYHDLLRHIRAKGKKVEDRTGVGSISVFGTQTRYCLRETFPAVTTKKLAWKAVVSELLWFLEGSNDERRLAELLYGKPRDEIKDKKTIWTANADKQGKGLGYQNDDKYKSLGPIYGVQWRDFNEASMHEGDQIKNLIERIKSNPGCRRLIVSAWNPLQIDEMALPACHSFVQFRVYGDELSCQMYQRSADTFLGVPFNIASYALLTHIIARECGLKAVELIHTIGDAHIYMNHMDQVDELLSRKPYPLPTLAIDDSFDLMELLDQGAWMADMDKFKLDGYKCHPPIKADMAV